MNNPLEIFYIEDDVSIAGKRVSHTVRLQNQ